MTEDDKAPTSEDEYYAGEQQLLGAIVLELASGKLDALANLLARGKPVSAAAASFLGAALQEETIGDYTPRRLVRVPSLGRPKTDSRQRVNRAALWVHWLVYKPNIGRHNWKREAAILRAAKLFHVDQKLIRKRLTVFEKRHFAPVHPRKVRKARLDTVADIARSRASALISQTKTDTC